MCLAFASRFIGALLLLLMSLNIGGQELKITLLGTGSPIPVLERFGPSILVEAGPEKLLIECGRGASLRLWQLHIPLGAATAVFLTHLHSDHVVGIPDLWLTGWLPPPFGHRTEAFQIWGPIGTKKMMANLQKAFATDIRFRMADGIPAQGIAIAAQDIVQGLVYERDGFGYRIDYRGRSVVFSGHTRPSENLVRFSKDVDVLIHEVAWARPELLKKSQAARIIIGLHTTPRQAGIIFARVKPRLAVYSHIVLITTDPAFTEPSDADVLKLTRERYVGPLEMGQDLMTIRIGNNIDVRRAGLPLR